MAYRRQVVRRNNYGFLHLCGQSMQQAQRVLLGPLLIAALAWGVIYGARCLYALPYFAVQKIEVGGMRVLSAEEVRRLSGVAYEDNIFAVDLSRTDRNLRSHPRIKKAALKKKFPHTIKISVRERSGMAAVKSGPLYYLVSRDGFVLQNLGAKRDKSLPLLEGFDPGDVRVGERLSKGGRLLKFLEKRELLGHFGRLDVRDEKKPVMYVRQGGVRVSMGESGWAEKIERYFMVRRSLGARVAAVRDIDLRYSNMVVVGRGLEESVKGR